MSVCVCSTLVYLPASPSSDSFFPHYLPPCKLLLNKQTNPLPLDTQLGCGDLLRLSGRILSNAVASVNKRKAPEARGVTYLFKVWIILLTRHSGVHPLSGVWTACRILKPDLCGICRPCCYPSSIQIAPVRSNGTNMSLICRQSCVLVSVTFWTMSNAVVLIGQ